SVEGKAQLESNTLSYLRRTAMLLHLAFGWPKPSSSFSDTTALSGIEKGKEKDDTTHTDSYNESDVLIRYLGFLSPHELFKGESGALASKWLQQHSTNVEAVRKPFPPLAFQLERNALPDIYQDLPFFISPSDTICKNCNTSPKPAAICLFCNSLLC